MPIANSSSLIAKVVGFIEAPAIGLDLPLDVRGTAFQERVWQALREIPAGSTASYTDIAQRIGAPKAVRAVAQACGANSLAVAIPCHRVVRSDGNLSGYRWGVERKRQLLERESAVDQKIKRSQPRFARQLLRGSRSTCNRFYRPCPVFTIGESCNEPMARYSHS